MSANLQSTPPKRILLSDYTAPKFRILSIDLHFDLHENSTLVKCIQVIEKIENAPLVLNGENLNLISVKIDQLTLTEKDYILNRETLSIASTPQKFTLETQVKINPEENKTCSGLYLSKGIFATQCEAEGFRNITYSLDRPDVMTSYTVTIEADKKKYPILLSNGDLISKKDLSSGKHQAVWKDPFKKPSYLFALVAGDLGLIESNFITKSGKNVKLEVYASHGKQNRCWHALESLKKAMKWDEERFGLEYDLNQYMIVSIDDFNMGAMENKGLNIFNSRLVLADPNSATDGDFDRIESVVGHEYFHNWTGNRVTCRNWFELSLKEGLTVFRDQEFSSDLNSRPVQRIKDVDALRGRQFSEDAGPNAHPVRPESCLAVDNFYTPTIYEKGSEVIRMMQTIVGTKGFRYGMDEYFKRHDGQAVTILDFADAISTPNKIDFTQFKLWYAQAGTPEVTVIEQYEADKKQYTLTLKQFCPLTEKQPKKKPFHIPLLVGLLDSNGNDLKLYSNDITYNSDEKPVIHLKLETQSFIFNHVENKPVLSLNREFSSPIKLNWNAEQTSLLHLIKFDSDSFNRREACYKMILQELQRLISCYQNGIEALPQAEIIEALGYILNDDSLDSQFKALMLQIPDEDILAQAENILDAQAFHSAQTALIKTLVLKFETKFINLYNKHHALNTPGDRALKNKILYYLIVAQNAQSINLAYKQYSEAQNMTDKLGALNSLAQTESAEKENALTDFYELWKNDAVVFNKWLQVQAGASLSSTFERVKKIYTIYPFSLDNPNNIYSLHAVLGSNYLALQNNNGEAIKWLCDEIIKIDKTNPQVAARVCGSFNFIRKFPEEIKTAALLDIKRVLARTELSKNSRELLETTLN